MSWSQILDERVVVSIGEARLVNDNNGHDDDGDSWITLRQWTSTSSICVVHIIITIINLISESIYCCYQVHPSTSTIDSSGSVFPLGMEGGRVGVYRSQRVLFTSIPMLSEPGTLAMKRALVTLRDHVQRRQRHALLRIVR